MAKRKRGEESDDEEFKLSDDEFIANNDDDDQDFEDAIDLTDEKGREKDDEDFVEEPPKKKKKTAKEETKKETKKKSSSKKTSSKKSKASPKTKDTKKKSSKKSSTVAIKDEGKAKELVFEYLKKQNRPYSIQNLIDNLHGQVKKAICQKSLDKLVKEKKVTIRESGKTKLYFLNQDDQEVLSKEELMKLDASNKLLDKERRELTVKVSSLQSEYSKLKKSLTNEQVVEKIKEIQERTEKKRTKLSSLKEGTELVKPEDKKNAIENLDKYIKVWKKRKNTTMEIINTLADAKGVKPNAIMKEIDIETDEMHKTSWKELGKLEE